MSVSSIPALKASLLAILQAAPALAGLSVYYGVPLPANPDEWIWLGDVTGDQTWMTFQKTRQEDYSLTVQIRAIRQGPDQQAATERAFQILAEIENALRADPTVGGTVLSADVHPTALVELAKPDGSGRGADLTCLVTVFNKI